MRGRKKQEGPGWDRVESAGQEKIRGGIVCSAGDEKEIVDKLEEFVYTEELREEFCSFLSAYVRACDVLSGDEPLHGFDDDGGRSEVGAVVSDDGADISSSASGADRLDWRSHLEMYSGNRGNLTPGTGVWISGAPGSGKTFFLRLLSWILADVNVDDQDLVPLLVSRIQDPQMASLIRQARGSAEVLVLRAERGVDDVSERADENSEVQLDQEAWNNQWSRSDQEIWREGNREISSDQIEDKIDRIDDIDRMDEERAEISGISLTPQISIEISGVQTDSEKIAYGGGGSFDGQEKSCTLVPTLSPEEFVALIRGWAEHCRSGRRLVLLIDDIGQIAAHGSAVLRQFPELLHELEWSCPGRVWVIAASMMSPEEWYSAEGDGQQISERARKRLQEDFPIRLSFSTMNIEEILHRRFLLKKEDATESVWNSYLSWKAAREKLLPEEEIPSWQEFYSWYPFLPEYMRPLRRILRAGWEKESPDAETKSVLGAFTAVLVRYVDAEIGTIIPFSAFYEVVELSLDADLVKRCRETKWIWRGRVSKCQAREEDVLKLLLMGQQLPSFHATQEKLVSLFLLCPQDFLVLDDEREKVERSEVARAGSVRQAGSEWPGAVSSGLDRGSLSVGGETSFSRSSSDNGMLEEKTSSDQLSLLQIQVQEALESLVWKGLIREGSGEYHFTSEEMWRAVQDIEQQSIESEVLRKRMTEILFTRVIAAEQLRIPGLSGKTPPAVRCLLDESGDVYSVGDQLRLAVITPEAVAELDEVLLRERSAQCREVLVVLGENPAARLVERCLKTERYLEGAAGISELTRGEIRADLQELGRRTEGLLRRAVEEAQIYVCGQRSQDRGVPAEERITHALGREVSILYCRRADIARDMQREDIWLMLERRAQTWEEVPEKAEENPAAQEAVKQYLGQQPVSRHRVTIYDLKVHFRETPYGYSAENVSWIVGRLMARGEVWLWMSGSQVTLQNHSVEQVMSYLTEKAYARRLWVERSRKRTKDELDAVRRLLREQYHASGRGMDADQLQEEYLGHNERMSLHLKEFMHRYDDIHVYPGREIVEQGLRLTGQVKSCHGADQFFLYALRRQEVLINFAQEFRLLEEFFDGDQKRIFDTCLGLLHLYDDSKRYLDDPQLDSVAERIRSVVKMRYPYQMICRLPEWGHDFSKRYKRHLEEHQISVLADIEQIERETQSDLQHEPDSEKVGQRCHRKFTALLKGVRENEDILVVYGYLDQARALRDDLLGRNSGVETTLTDVADGKILREGCAESQHRPEIIDASELLLETRWQVRSRRELAAQLRQLQKQLEDLMQGEGPWEIRF